ncbi:MAG: gluzincin family metallopeptidase [Planctomycetota bacterium]|jgi:hypothetical protein
MGSRLLGFTLLLALSVGSTAGTLSLGKRYRDDSSGFQIQIPSKWEQVPTKFQDVATVGKWTGKAETYDAYDGVLYVLRFLEVAEKKEEETPEDVLKRGIPGYSDLLRRQPKSVWEYVEKFFWGKFDIVEDDPDFKAKKGLKIHFRVYKARLREGADAKKAAKRQRMIIGAQVKTVEKSDSCYGIVYGCSVADEKNMLRTFKSSISRFRVLDPDVEDDEEEGVSDEDIFVNSEEKPEAWRAARKRKLIPGWDAVDTKNYLIVFNRDVKKPLLKQIAKHIEAIREQIYEQLFPPAKEVTAISVVRVCKDRGEYHRYGGPPGSAGYWSRGDEELVFYQDKSNKKDSLRVLYHEAFHQYIHYAVGDVAPHSWFNEGHGDYFAGHNYVSRKFMAKPFRWRTGIISSAIGQKTYVPLSKFLKYTQGEYYANAGLCYAQGWSFVYFLREVERRKIRKYKKYWGLLDRYFEGIKRNVKSVKEKGIEGLNQPPEKPDSDKEPEEEVEDPGEVTAGTEPTGKPVGLPRLPGLEKPFPGEHPEAGAGEADGAKAQTGETRSVAGPQINSVKTALDAAVDDAFKGIDIEQLEKDWITFSK